MSDHASRLEVEYVPVNLRNDGMIAAREGAPCPQINFVKYVLATDYAQAHAQGRREGLEEAAAVADGRAQRARPDSELRADYCTRRDEAERIAAMIRAKTKEGE